MTHANAGDWWINTHRADPLLVFLGMGWNSLLAHDLGPGRCVAERRYRLERGETVKWSTQQMERVRADSNRTLGPPDACSSVC